MKLLSIEYIPGMEYEALGIVKGTVVQTKNIGRDFMAGMKTLVGGEIVGYTEMLNLSLIHIFRIICFIFTWKGEHRFSRVGI